jgi:hypothetical protein
VVARANNRQSVYIFSGAKAPAPSIPAPPVGCDFRQRGNRSNLDKATTAAAGTCFSIKYHHSASLKISRTEISSYCSKSETFTMWRDRSSSLKLSTGAASCLFLCGFFLLQINNDHISEEAIMMLVFCTESRWIGAFFIGGGPCSIALGVNTSVA